MRISGYPSPEQIMTDQKQRENVEYFNCSDNMITSETKYAREINSRNAMAKATISEKKGPFTNKLDVNLRKKLVRCYIWCTAFVWC